MGHFIFRSKTFSKSLRENLSLSHYKTLLLFFMFFLTFVVFQNCSSPLWYDKFSGETEASNASGWHQSTDFLAPTITINVPSTESAYSTSSSSVVISGIASDNVALSALSCISSTGASCVVTGSAFWSTNAIALTTGTNVITVTAKDASENVSTASITITHSTLDNGQLAKLLFRSGFENGVVLEPAFIATDWWQRLSGSDVSGFSWPFLGGKFQYVVEGTRNLSDYMQTRIEQVIGPHGNSTKALMHGVWNNGGHPSGCSQSPYISYLDTPWEGDMYVRFWVKFNEDWQKNIKPWDWRMLWEWKAGGGYEDGYRRNMVMASADGSGRITWHATIDGPVKVGATQPIVYWDQINSDVPVPSGQWFEFEVFSRPRSDINGAFWVAVNGKTIFDYKGATLSTSKIGRIMWFTVYGPAKPDKPIYQWVDDFEVWDGKPY